MRQKHIRYTALTLISVFVVYVGIRLYTQKTVKQAVDAEIQKISQFAEVQYNDLEVDILRPRARLKDIVISPRFWKNNIRVEEGIFYGSAGGDGSPSIIRFNLTGIQLDVDHAGATFEPYIVSLDLPNVKADLAGSVIYDKKKSMLYVEQIKLDAHGLGQAEISLRLNNINPETIESLPENIFMLLLALSGVSIESATIHYVDGSLMDKIMSISSPNQAEPLQTHQIIVRRLDQAFNQETDPEVKHAIKGLRDFIKNRDRISIVLAPEKPVSFAKLFWIRSTKQLIDLLGLKISV